MDGQKNMTMPMVLLSNWSGQITAAWNKSRENVIEVGRLLIKAKEALPHGLFIRLIEGELPFGDRTAQRLMAIAGDQRLANPTHASHLPQSWMTLYELTKLDDAALADGIERAVIRPDMERKDLAELRREPVSALPGTRKLDSEPEGMRIKFARPQIGEAEIAAAVAALGNPRLTNAGHVQAFESKFSEMIGGGMAVATSSCTSALHMALLALKIGPGDEVIVPALTFAACAHVVEAVGATPVFADVHPEAGQLDPEDVEPRITPRTKAIMVMHFAGRPGYMGSFQAMARRRNVKIIEDAATALGALHSGKHVGLLGDVGCFSFHPVKHITTCEGGMLVTHDAEIAARAKLIREFGKEASPYDQQNGRSTMPYEIKSFGLNFRMTELSGAIGVAQLDTARKRLEIRRSNYRKLVHALDGLEILDLGGDESAAYCMVVHMPKNRDAFAIRRALAARHIETSVYYPGPLPLMPYYGGKYRAEDFPHSTRIAQNAIALSVGPHLGSAEMAYTAQQLKEVLR